MAFENQIIYGALPAEFFGFDDMVGALQPKREETQLIGRIGQDGERLRKTGVRARPSQITTFLYVDDLADSKQLLTDYLTLIDGAPYEILQHGESYGYFRVLDITAQQDVAVGKVVGHIGGGTPTYLQAVDWIVLGTDPPPP